MRLLFMDTDDIFRAILRKIPPMISRKKHDEEVFELIWKALIIEEGLHAEIDRLNRQLQTHGAK